MNYLLLPPQHTPDDSSIWRAAIRRGFKTVRLNPREHVDIPTDATQTYYYGNTLHVERCRQAGVPLRVERLDPLWPNRVVDRAVFGRGVWPVSYRQFSEFKEERPYFVKCVHEKWFKPLICTPSSLPDGCSMPDDILHVQDVVTFLDEVRCWVRGGEILTWSYYRKDRQLWSEENNGAIPARWQHLVDAVRSALPEAIIVDLGRMEDGEWYVIEANEPWAAGIYECDPDRCLDVIVACQPINVPAT